MKSRLSLSSGILPPTGPARVYELHGDAGHVMLDPRWHQAAWAFVKFGFFHILDGVDHLLFLLCLILPFRRVSWTLVGVITSFTVAHSITLIAAAYGWFPGARGFRRVETLIAASIIYMALENVLRPNLRWRWVVDRAVRAGPRFRLLVHAETTCERGSRCEMRARQSRDARCSAKREVFSRAWRANRRSALQLRPPTLSPRTSSRDARRCGHACIPSPVRAAYCGGRTPSLLTWMRPTAVSRPSAPTAALR